MRTAVARLCGLSRRKTNRPNFNVNLQCGQSVYSPNDALLETESPTADQFLRDLILNNVEIGQTSEIHYNNGASWWLL